MRSPTLLPIRMNAAETSASSAMADWTPLTVVPISRTTAEIDTFISDVSTTSTNIAIASRMASRWLLFAVSGTPVLTLWVIRALLDLLTHASCQRVCRLGLGHHPPAGDPDPNHATRANTVSGVAKISRQPSERHGQARPRRQPPGYSLPRGLPFRQKT